MLVNFLPIYTISANEIKTRILHLYRDGGVYDSSLVRVDILFVVHSSTAGEISCEVKDIKRITLDYWNNTTSISPDHTNARANH